MAKALRWAGYGLAGLLGLVAVAALTVWILSERALADTGDQRALSLATPTAAQLADAPRMLKVNGCLNCHGDGLAGKQFGLDPQIATVYSPNLTRLAATVDDATLDRAIRGGIGHDGKALVIMPSSGYQALTDQEVAALIAAIRAFPVSGDQVPKRKIGPLGRIGLATGQFHSQPALVAQYAANPIPSYGPATAKGRHLVATNCSECHGADLKGRELSPGLVSADLTMAGAYDIEQFKTLLRTGVAPGKKKLRLMDDVSQIDFRHMTDEEIAAVHAYLVERAGRMP